MWGARMAVPPVCAQMADCEPDLWIQGWPQLSIILLIFIIAVCAVSHGNTLGSIFMLKWQCEN